MAAKKQLQLTIPLPWQQQQWQMLTQQANKNNLHHALLFKGSAGLGTLEFAREFAKYLLCQDDAKTNTACHRCHSCNLTKNGDHPDYREIGLIDTARAIKVDQIRQLAEQATMSNHYRGYKVVIINPADAMNLNAANALLKTLEEPSNENLILILLATQAQQLPATIRSRCMSVEFSVPEKTVLNTWLAEHIDIKICDELIYEIAEGEPLAIINLMNSDELQQYQQIWQDLKSLANHEKNPASIFTAWEKTTLANTLKIIAFWLSKLVMAKSVPTTMLNKSSCQDLITVSQHCTQLNLFNLLDFLYQQNQLIINKISINARLFYESFYNRWNEVFTS